jgi:hypothetical protein
MRRSVALMLGSAALAAATHAHAQVSLLGQFSTGTSSVGMGYDALTNTVWTYPSFGSEFRRYSTSGTLLGAIPRPGGSANDADVEFAPVAFSLAGTVVPAGTLIYIDGESGVAEIYAVNPATGALLSTLVSAFGTSHVVGGAYHPQRGTLFLVQDRVPGGTAANRIAEINASTGAVLNSFLITAASPGYTVNFGDLDVAANGNLVVVSSNQNALLELTPTGAFVGQYALPAAVNGLCGVGVHDAACEIWVLSTSGVASRLGGFTPGGPFCPSPPCDPDLNQDGNVDQDDVAYLINVVGGGANPTGIDPDFNHDGNADQDDVIALINVIAGGGCP